MTIGSRIKEARESRDWTQDELARKLGLTWVTVSRWERGVNPPPRSRLPHLASVLDLTVEELVDGAGTVAA